MGSLNCCKLRTCVLLIGAAFLVMQTAMLVLNFFAMRDVAGNVEAVVGWFRAKADELGDEDADEDEDTVRMLMAIKEAIVKRATDFIAIPITVNVVLMIADSLVIWASVSQHRILLWPWLVLHLIEWLILLGLLVYFMVALPKPFLKVILFLIVCPFLVVFAFCWFVVRCFYKFLKDLDLKEAVTEAYKQSNQKQYPPTVYSTSDPGQQHWDQPLPIWAGNPSSTGGSEQAYVQRTDHSNRTKSHVGSGGRRTPAGSLGGGAGRSRNRRRNKPSPTMLPDGTLVVPIAEDSEDDDTTAELPEIEEEDEEIETVHGRMMQRPMSRHSRVAPSAISDDRTSSVAMSLSDKYRQLDEFEESFHVLPPAPKPPKPIPPPQARNGGSRQTNSYDTQSTSTGSVRRA